MSKPRPLDLDQIERWRADGLKWREIAEKLGWAAPALKERLNREGWHEKTPAGEGPVETGKEKKQSLKARIYELFKTGVTIEIVAASMDKTPEQLAAACRCDILRLQKQARAEAAIELAEAIYSRAINGDKAAISQYKRSLQ